MDEDAIKVKAKWGDALYKTEWLGVQARKNPCDCWIYQMIIFETQPDIIIETGSYRGGSGLFFASMLDLIGKGEVVSMDNVNYTKPSHPRITWINGGSTEEKTFNKVKEMCQGKRVMLNLDSCHVREHVLKELELYAPLVSSGCYAIVEDTLASGYDPGAPGQMAGQMGPGWAVEQYLKEHKEFEIDKEREMLLITHCENGFLKRK